MENIFYLILFSAFRLVFTPEMPSSGPEDREKHFYKQEGQLLKRVKNEPEKGICSAKNDTY
jgi:hypothetical protein